MTTLTLWVLVISPNSTKLSVYRLGHILRNERGTNNCAVWNICLDAGTIKVFSQSIYKHICSHQILEFAVPAYSNKIEYFSSSFCQNAVLKVTDMGNNGNAQGVSSQHMGRGIYERKFLPERHHGRSPSVYVHHQYLILAPICYLHFGVESTLR